MFQPGDKVAEHLELVRLLGAGGMGSVWVARHLRLRTEVAVKFLSATMLNNSAARSRFDREAQWVAQVKSPHVVQVLDQGVTSSEPPQPYIVMELLEGEDLGQVLERRGALPLSETAIILDQVSSGLAAAHASGLVHRDIKPENIFLLSGERPFVKILDFGVARATFEASINRLTHTGGVIGTAHYMSPEQLFEGKQVDQRTDVWALGVVSYRMLTGHLPFDGNTYGDLCLAVNQGSYIPPSQRAGLPTDVDAFIARALATDRTARFATAKEFASELTALAYRHSANPMLPLHSGSGVTGEYRPSTGDRPSATLGATLQNTQTDAGAAVTVESVPMNRSNLLAVGALVGLIVVGAVVFGAIKLWSDTSESRTDVGAPAKGDSPAEAAAKGAGAQAPARTPALETNAKNGLAPVEASTKAADVEASPSGSAGDRATPAPHTPAGRTPTPRVAKQAQRTAPTPAPKLSTNKVSSNDSASGSTTGTKPPQPIPKEKYRGF